MAVSTTQAPVIYPFAASSDKRYPVAKWISRESVAGDATGGAANITIQWSAKNPLLAFSLETFSATKVSSVTAENVIWYLATGQLAQGGIGMLLRDAIAFLSSAAQGDMALYKEYKSLIWVPNDDSTQWNILASINNPGVGATFVTTMWGFVWDRESLKLPGGPLRPGEFPPPL